MSTSTATIQVPAEEVWAVLSDGWLCPLFVVGLAEVHKVDRTWPQLGARLHHCLGSQPVPREDQTSVLAVDPGRRLVLLARTRAGGAAEVGVGVGSRSRSRCGRRARAPRSPCARTSHLDRVGAG